MLPSGWPHTLRVMDHTLAVDATGVTKAFGSVLAVDNVSVQVDAGEVYGVLGPNGAGKTTFLRMLFGLIRPDAGTIRVFGKTWDQAGVGVLDGVAGFIESPRFYPYLTGRANLEGLALLQDSAQRVRPDLRLQSEVDEAGTGDIDGGDQIVGAQSFGDPLGEITRFCPGLLGQHHRGVGRHIAMAGVARRLDNDAGEIDAFGPIALRRERGADRVHARQHVGKKMQ